MPFEVKTAGYEGPLELLVSLIEKREVFINDISLTQVCDDYLETLNTMDRKDIDNMSDFVVIASTLLLIKSKSLLPNLSLSVEEEENIEDLEKRVEVYRQFKDIAREINSLLEHGNHRFTRGDVTLSNKEISFAPGTDMSLENIFQTANELIAQIPTEEKRPTVKVEKTISLEEVIDDLKVRAQESMKMSFNSFSNKSGAEKVDVIIRFLALLELVKTGTLRAEQNDDFDDIIIETDSIDTPYYG